MSSVPTSIHVAVVGLRGAGKKTFMLRWLSVEKGYQIHKIQGSKSLTVQGEHYSVEFFNIEPQSLENSFIIDYSDGLQQHFEKMYSRADAFAFIMAADEKSSLDEIKFMASQINKFFAARLQQTSSYSMFLSKWAPANNTKTTSSKPPIAPRKNTNATSTTVSSTPVTPSATTPSKMKRSLSLMSLFTSSSSTSDVVDSLTPAASPTTERVQPSASPELTEFTPFPRLLVGNKADLPGNMREITISQGLKLGDELQTAYLETCTSTGRGVDTVVEDLVKQVIKWKKTQLLTRVEQDMSKKKSTSLFGIKRGHSRSKSSGLLSSDFTSVTSAKDGDQDFLDMLARAQQQHKQQ